MIDTANGILTAKKARELQSAGFMIIAADRLSELERTAAEADRLKEELKIFQSTLVDNERLIAEMSENCTCGVWDGDEEDEEDAFIPLPPDLQTLPEIHGFASVSVYSTDKTEFQWKPISGKRVEVEGIIAILHTDFDKSLPHGWQLTELTTGIRAGTAVDPVDLISRACDAIRRNGGKNAVLAATRARIGNMPPNPELDALIAQEEHRHWIDELKRMGG